jgi:formate-dependent phosphoribosylglycinamide formyltransferase (GAR transformylase)
MAEPAALRVLIECERPAIVVPEIEAIATDALVDIERDGAEARERARQVAASVRPRPA